MNPVQKVAIVILHFVSVSGVLFAQQVHIVDWPTTSASPPLRAESEQEQLLLNLGRTAVGFVAKESQLVGLSSTAAAAFGVKGKALDEMQAKLAAYYRKVDSDPLFKELPTLLNYSFSSSQPDHGKATVYHPKVINDQTRTIVFLHGFGGSFHWYLHFMISCFPNDVIICPVYGLSPYQIKHQYVNEAIQVAYQKLGKQPNGKPYLICLSAGGFGGFRLASNYPSEYPKLVVMGAFPPSDLPNAVESEVRVLVGANEVFVKDGTLRSNLQAKVAKGKVKGRTIADADHFFMLTHEAQTRQILQGWIEVK